MQNNNNSGACFTDECDIMAICKSPTDESRSEVTNKTNIDVCKCIGSWNIIETFTKTDKIQNELSKQQQNNEDKKYFNSHFASWVSTTLPIFCAVIIDPGMKRDLPKTTDFSRSLN